MIKAFTIKTLLSRNRIIKVAHKNMTAFDTYLANSFFIRIENSDMRAWKWQSLV